MIKNGTIVVCFDHMKTRQVEVGVNIGRILPLNGVKAGYMVRWDCGCAEDIREECVAPLPAGVDPARVAKQGGTA